MTEKLPTIDELALGAFLHDAGKLLQRGIGTIASLPEQVRNLEGELCPVYEHRYSHKHVLFTELLFHDLETDQLRLPGGLERSRVREAAVYHHHPDPRRPWTWLVAVADRLSAGMDRTKSADAADEQESVIKGWDAFRKKPLKSILSTVKLEKCQLAKEHWLRPLEATPESIVSSPDKRSSFLPDDYAVSTKHYRSAFKELCRDLRLSADLLHEGAIGLGERFWWGVPSSTMDEPDVPLLDHSVSVAAFASCLHAHHVERGELLDVGSIKDLARPKFRLLRGDLSGIQASLFRLAAQQVKGINRILRARSFLMGQLVEAAALLVRRDLGLPPYVVLMRAGGQFTMLLPEVEGIEAKVAAVQARIDQWMATRYAGELALVMGLTNALPASAFLGAQIGTTLDMLRRATERAKERPIADFLAANGPVLQLDYEEGADGACPACGVRPAKKAFTSALDSVSRCEACHHEHELGQKLPKLQQLVWLDGPSDEALVLFDEVRLRVVGGNENAFTPRTNIRSAWKPWGSDAAWPIATRPIASFVPQLSEQDLTSNRYSSIQPEDGETQPEAGDLKTMSHIAIDAREPDGGTWRGKAMLAVLKADVDNLGQVFATGLGERRSIGRLVALSRSLDWFFTGRLPALLRGSKIFCNTYTVYAGGDDLLLIGPWLQTVKLAGELRREFGAYCGDNPSLTLSAGVELVSAREPLGRSADRAERRLEQAKRVLGKDRLGLMGEVLSWTDAKTGLPWLLERSDWLTECILDDEAGGTFVYKLLGFLDQRAKADKGDTNAAIWRARYGYHLARKFPKDQKLWMEFNRLMGIEGASNPPSGAAISMAMWRNR